MEFKDKKIKMTDGDEVVITDTMVCKSAAGYFLGRYCKTVESKHEYMMDCIEPWDRMTGYYATREIAEEALKTYAMVDETLIRRQDEFFKRTR